MKTEATSVVPRGAAEGLKREAYRVVEESVAALLEGEDDWIAALATTVTELHHAFAYFDWTGFYRVKGDRLLVIGPYQGGHGCLRIPFDKGVCGACARSKQTLIVPDVHAFEGHIACASSTLSEIVIPVLSPSGELLAVLDVDSDDPAAFTREDADGLERICRTLVRQVSSPCAS